MFNRWHNLYFKNPKKWDEYSKYQDKDNLVIKTLLLNLDLVGKTVLELGCGSGMYTNELAKRCKILYALDQSLPVLNIAKSKINSKNVEYVEANIVSIPLEKKPVDFIFSSFAYPPYEYEDKCEQEIKRVAKKGCEIYLVNNHPCGEFMKLRGNEESYSKRKRLNWYKRNGYKLKGIIKTKFNFPDLDTAKRCFINVFGDEVKSYIDNAINLNIERQISVHYKKFDL